MALSKESTEKAIAILREINPDIQGETGYYDSCPPLEECPADMIIGYGRKDDGGYEGVFTIVRDMTHSQAAKWSRLIEGVRNTSVFKPLPGAKATDHVRDVCIGWF